MSRGETLDALSGQREHAHSGLARLSQYCERQVRANPKCLRKEIPSTIGAVLALVYRVRYVPSCMANAAEGHVFLSHAGVDTAAAHQFAEILRRNGLTVWFDKDSTQPGDPWMTALEQAMFRYTWCCRCGRISTPVA